MKPLIAITTNGIPDDANTRTGGTLELNWNYAQVVADFGGVPLLIPPMADMDEVAKVIDGWLIPGGNDLNPAYWGDELHPAAKLIEPERPAGEMRLMKAIPEAMPVFGICYGCQFINIARGGDLHQHLDDLLGHGQHAKGVIDGYTVEAETKLATALASCSVEGKSYHHQGVRKVGDNLKVTARNSEGIVEALEATDRPWMVGVQWHPERTSDDPITQNLFRAFIEQARAYAQTKKA